MTHTTICSACSQPLAADQLACAACGAEQRATTPPIDLAEMEALRQATLGDFDIAGVLGRGGMATVYLGHDLTLDRKVAIKVMSRAVLHGGGADRFRREARTAAALSHPNIIPIYTVKQVDDLLFFVMKFVSGRSLDSIVEEAGPLPIAMVQAVLSQVAGALGYAHRQGVVHRDVKPANIIIDDEGWAVVTDFGIARVADSTGLTTAGTTVGTPSYMSPEQCLADAEITGAADQYALGVLAYEMLTGTTPFAGKTTLSMMYAHVHDKPRAILDVRPDCPRDLAVLVERMLAKGVEERWPSLDEAITALGAVPMSYDDPTRSQMIALAKTGQQAQISALLRTPRSPIPVMRRPTPSPTNALPAAAAAPRDRFNSVLRAAVAIAALVAVVVALKTMQPSAAEPTVVVDTVIASAPPPAVVETAPAPAPVTPAAPAAARPSGPTATGGAKVTTAAKAEPAVVAVAAPREAPSAVVVLDVAEETGAAPTGGVTGATAFGVGGAAASAEASLDKDAITRAISSYADALAAGDLPAAQRAFPTMGVEKAGRLGDFFATGGRMKLRWRVIEISKAKGGAVARVVGSTTDIPATGESSTRTIDDDVGVALVKGAWRVRSFPN